MNLRQILERKKTFSFDAIRKTLGQVFAIKFNRQTYVKKNLNTLDHTHTFHGQS